MDKIITHFDFEMPETDNAYDYVIADLERHVKVIKHVLYNNPDYKSITDLELCGELQQYLNAINIVKDAKRLAKI